jgi:hypothetical protein
MPDGSVETKQPLSPRQKALADAYCRNITEQLGFSQHELAIAAGYANNDPHSLRVMASRTLRLPQVQAYIRERAREYLAEGGMEVAAALRELTSQRDDKRVRLDAAKAVGLAIGLTARDDAGGPGVVLNLVLGGNGAALVQQPGDAAQVIENAAQSRAARSLVQGEGRRPAVRMVTAPPLALAHAQGGVGGGGGDRGGAGEEEGGPPSQLPPETVGGGSEAAPKISAPSKPAKSVGVAKKRTVKRKKARVVRKPRVKSDV